MSRSRSLLALVGLLTIAGTLTNSSLKLALADNDPPATAAAEPSADPTADLAALLAKASVEGKYRMLLRQFKSEEDREKIGDFKDEGMQERAEYGGLTELPKGHWVYAYPYWFIWRDLSSSPLPKRNWGTEQVLGEPDTDEAGDNITAWASLGQDDREEWLLLEYAEPVKPLAVQIHETYNPGAVSRIAALAPDGSEQIVWSGQDPTPSSSDKGISVIPFRTDYPITRLKVYLDSVNVPGWNEIDAVGLRDTSGQTHWATVAEASTTYAAQEERTFLAVVQVPTQELAQMQERITRLEAQISDLTKLVTELKEALKVQQNTPQPSEQADP